MQSESALALYNWVTFRTITASQVRAVALVAADGRKAAHTITRRLIGIVFVAARDFERTMIEELFVSDAAVRAVVRRLADEHGIAICDDYLRQWRR